MTFPPARSHPRSVIGPAVLAVALGAGCRESVETNYYEYPEVEYSVSTLEFGTLGQGDSTSKTVYLKNAGDLPMGVSSVTMGEEDKSDQFEVTWNANRIDCPETDTGAAAEEKYRNWAFDSGYGDDTGQSDPGGDTGDSGAGGSEGTEFVLDPDCRIPFDVTFSPDTLGTLYGSLIITTATEEVGEEATPAYWADPLLSRSMVYLVGEADWGSPNIVVNPRSHDYGHLWTGEVDSVYVTIENAGEGDLTLDTPTVDDDCDEGFELVNLEEEDSFQSVLEGGQSTFLEIQYTAEDTDAAYCTVTLPSDDEDSPEIDISLQANAGEDPDNEPPTVYIRDPDVGYQHVSGDEISLEINIFDANQPADTLDCYVKSMIIEQANVGTCTPDDESGHVFLDVDVSDWAPGVDTLRVQVTDAAGETSYASVSVLVNTAYDDSDDDGDGWGEEEDDEGNYDCDDTSLDTYPYAAEQPDGLDNDCDGVVDEGTAAYDDDGDSFSEDDGDCNDYDDEVYPGAMEQPDQKDNDCDDIIDEGTSVYDDDGDGYTEMNNDCDDNDPEVNPGAVEYCDGVDNDCNGLKDYQDGCLETDSSPYVVGGINMQQTACEENEQLTLSVLIFDPDGQELEYAWSGDEGLTVDPLSGSATVTVTCPELDSSSDGELYGLYVVGTDEDGHQVWDFDDLAVYPSGKLNKQYTETVTSEPSLCAAVGPGAGAILALIGLGLSLARRREE